MAQQVTEARLEKDKQERDYDESTFTWMSSKTQIQLSTQWKEYVYAWQLHPSRICGVQSFPSICIEVTALLQGFNTSLKPAIGPQSSQIKKPKFFIIIDIGPESLKEYK